MWINFLVLSADKGFSFCFLGSGMSETFFPKESKLTKHMSTKQKKHKYHKLSLTSPISHGIIHLCKERRGLYPRGPITENWSSPKQGIPCNAHQNTFSIYYYFIINLMRARGYSTSSGFLQAELYATKEEKPRRAEQPFASLMEPTSSATEE